MREVRERTLSYRSLYQSNTGSKLPLNPFCTNYLRFPCVINPAACLGFKFIA